MKLCTVRAKPPTLDEAILADGVEEQFTRAFTNDPCLKAVLYVPMTGQMYIGTSVTALAPEVMASLKERHIKTGHVDYMHVDVLREHLLPSGLQRNV
jgi:hypothetical protein